jgi:serine/threonine protein kinase
MLLMKIYCVDTDEGDVQVLTHVAERLADLHAGGYVHRDIKPGNIMWLPRKKRWTLIDFGCAARIGHYARPGFSLFYAAPEVILAHESGRVGVTATEAMFTGQPVFNLLQSREKVCSCHSDWLPCCAHSWMLCAPQVPSGGC